MNNQYYYFVTGLPDFSFDSPKLPFTIAEFRTVLNEALQPKDKALVNRYLLQYDNENLIALLKNDKTTLSNKGVFSSEQLKAAVAEVQADTKFSNENVPAYFADYINVWLAEETENETEVWEDLMASFYMDYGMDSRNSFIARWFEFNLNIGNILSAIYSRKYNMPIAEIIVSNNETAKTIRENVNARDFGLGSDIDYFETLVRLSEETDIYERERKIDEFRWKWLTENTEFNVFGIEYIFAWLCKLQIAERWINLNAEKGEQVFRELIADLKSEVEVPKE
ncbi:MAG: DUF2764 domain-containing protein [Dysgonamonadaceae bacterium]|jgi:hypothetical protein|nr:DUF2764 domain-containing protein [Dysgonamonadaceae bacterium]